jgi:hypothetical protein
VFSLLRSIKNLQLYLACDLCRQLERQHIGVHIRLGEVGNVAQAQPLGLGQPGMRQPLRGIKPEAM